MSKGAFGEPLQVQRNGLGQDTAGVLDRDGKLLPYDLDADGRLPHWRRIVACVNAMDGIEDPAGFVFTAMLMTFGRPAAEVCVDSGEPPPSWCPLPNAEEAPDA